jgi:predicted ATPase
MVKYLKSQKRSEMSVWSGRLLLRNFKVVNFSTSPSLKEIFGPYEAYKARVGEGEIRDDAQQHDAMKELDRLNRNLCAIDPAHVVSLAFCLFSVTFLLVQEKVPRGMYLWCDDAL